VDDARERQSLRVLTDRGVGSWIERRAHIAPDQLALINGDTRRTYVELADRVRRLAHGLRGLDVQRGDRVGWLGANHPAFLEVLFATASIGAVLAPVNHRPDHTLISDVLVEFSPRVVVVERSAAGIPIPSGVEARVVVGAATAADVDYEHLVAESPEPATSDPGTRAGRPSRWLPSSCASRRPSNRSVRLDL
jgi:acyl-CoA synthetase (AMP-forming)/AMP-acid ligase II